MVKHLHKLGRIRDLIQDPVYRKVVLSKILCFLLAKLNPNLRYLGLDDGDTKSFYFLRDNVITPYSIASGVFQKGDLLTIIELSDKYGFDLGKAFVDVGANIGTTTMSALKSGRFNKVVAIEPASSNLELLRLNLTANALETKVSLFEGAASENEGFLNLSISEANCGDHRVSFSRQHESREMVQIKVNPLDQIIANAGLSVSDISFVWVDTQGHEGFVLSGATSLLKAKVPFCIEFWPDGLKEADCFERLLDIIAQHFEQFIDLRSQSLEPRATKDLLKFSSRFFSINKHTDLFLIPRR